jgi:hypothetical protein
VSRSARRLALGALVALGLVTPALRSSADTPLPVILQVVAPARMAVGTTALVRVRFRAPRADVVTLVLVADDLDGSGQVLASRQRALNVLARAFGDAQGELTAPIAFSTPGRKRVTLTLVTDEGLESDAETVDLHAVP